MRGTSWWLLGATLISTLSSPRSADACSLPPPPLALNGVPAAGAVDVPTDVVPVFDYVSANFLDASRLPLSTFEFVADSGETITGTPQPTYVGHFEIVPSEELAPQTSYVLHAVVPSRPGSEPATAELKLSFTTGDGPLDGEPSAPSARVQHWSSFGSVQYSICGPNPAGTCLFFQTAGPYDAVLVDELGAEQGYHYLLSEQWETNISEAQDGTTFRCVVLRTRAEDGVLSDPVEVCRDDGEGYRVTGDITDLDCTEDGLTRGGAPITSDPSGGTGGSGTGGSETGGSDTGGSPNGGAPNGGAPNGGTGVEPEPGDDGSRTVVTEGCGCSVPGSARGAGAGVLVAASLFVIARRRRTRGNY